MYVLYIYIYTNTHLVLVHDLICMHTSPFLYVSLLCIYTHCIRKDISCWNLACQMWYQMFRSVSADWCLLRFPIPWAAACALTQASPTAGKTKTSRTTTAPSGHGLGGCCWFHHGKVCLSAQFDSHLYDWYFVQYVLICLIHRCILYSGLIWCDMLFISSDCWVNIVICLQYLYPDPDPTLA